MMDTLEARYGLSPNDREALPLREILLKIDEAILAKNIVAYDLYVAYWRRYMIITFSKMSMRGIMQSRRAPTRASPPCAPRSRHTTSLPRTSTA